MPRYLKNHTDFGKNMLKDVPDEVLVGVEAGSVAWAVNKHSKASNMNKAVVVGLIMGAYEYFLKQL